MHPKNHQFGTSLCSKILLFKPFYVIGYVPVAFLELPVREGGQPAEAVHMSETYAATVLPA